MQRAFAPLRQQVLPCLAPRAYLPAMSVQARSYASKKKSGKQTSDPPPKKTVSKGHQMMPDEVEAFNMAKMEKNMQDHIERLRINLKSVVGRVGTVSADLLDSVRVQDESGDRFKINDYAHVSIKDASTLHVNLYDPDSTGLVEKALGQAKIPLSPVRIGKGVIQIKVSRPNEDLREKLAREASGICEAARVAIRADRHRAQKALKNSLEQKMSKNIAVAENKQLDETTTAHTKQVDQIANEAKAILLDQ